jgi:hypothetical protein
MVNIDTNKINIKYVFLSIYSFILCVILLVFIYKLFIYKFILSIIIMYHILPKKTPKKRRDAI